MSCVGSNSGEIPFGFEERLQELIASTPDLLASPRWPGDRILLGREIPAHGQLEIVNGPLSERQARERRGWMDVCFMEADGMPTIVEVKLAGNVEMRTVLTQAKGYAEALFANPVRAARTMRSALGSLADRSPISRSVSRMIEDILPGWTPDDVHDRIKKHLEEQCCRIVVAADAVPPEIVSEAARLQSSLGGISLDLINVRRLASGSSWQQHIAMNPAAYERIYRPPPVAAPEWEAVGRMPVRAADFMRRMVKDRFYGKHGDYRIKQTRSLPAVLHYEVAPGRAPKGDLHQVDRSRRESCAPVMPVLDLLFSEEKNPYPSDGWHRTVVTDDRYRDIVRVCYATWEFLRKNGSITFRIDEIKEMQRKIVKSARVNLDGLSSEVGWVALTAPFDAMRDCALYGLVRHSRRGYGEHRFEMSVLPSEFPIERW